MYVLAAGHQGGRHNPPSAGSGAAAGTTPKTPLTQATGTGSHYVEGTQDGNRNYNRDYYFYCHAL